MARWRTHNKRARRQRGRNAQLTRNAEDAMAVLVRALDAHAIENGLAKVFRDLGRALETFALEFRKAVEQAMATVPPGWTPLDPKYARLRREEWPDVVYEDILDADVIGE